MAAGAEADAEGPASLRREPVRYRVAETRTIAAPATSPISAIEGHVSAGHQCGLGAAPDATAWRCAGMARKQFPPITSIFQRRDPRGIAGRESNGRASRISTKAAEIEAWVDQVEQTSTVLPLDGRTFRLWAKLMHQRSDDLIEDALIAATALTAWTDGGHPQRARLRPVRCARPSTRLRFVPGALRATSHNNGG